MFSDKNRRSNANGLLYYRKALEKMVSRWTRCCSYCAAVRATLRATPPETSDRAIVRGASGGWGSQWLDDTGWQDQASQVVTLGDLPVL